jgi:lysophospholipase L1-like esterase
MTIRESVGIAAVTTSSRSERKRARYSSADLDGALGFAVALLGLGVVLTTVQGPSDRSLQFKPIQRFYEKSNTDGSVKGVGVKPPGPRLAPPSATLKHFNESTKKRADGDRVEPLRVMWLGDSHTAGVSWPGSFESVILTRMTSGGPGYLPLGLNYGRFHGARIASDDGFDIAPHPPAKRALEDDGVFGLGGTRVSSREKTIGITIRFDPNLANGDVECQLLYRCRESSDRVAVVVGGKRLEVTGDSVSSFAGGLRAFSFKADAHAVLEIRTLSGNPELFGLVAENERKGLVMDVLGINGARFATPLSWDEDSWKSLVKWRHPTLVIVAYGTNEVFDLISPERYRPEIQRLIGRIRSAVPDAECIVAGPTAVGRGGRTAEGRVAAIDHVEAETAEQLGCAYFSPYQTMGGALGFDAWLHATPALAAPDRIHLSAAGYRKLGETMGHFVLGD